MRDAECATVEDLRRGMVTTLPAIVQAADALTTRICAILPPAEEVVVAAVVADGLRLLLSQLAVLRSGAGA